MPQASQLFYDLTCGLFENMAPGGGSPNWDVFLSLCSVQTAVINVFKGGGLQSNELYALNESIRYLAGQNQCCFPVRVYRIPTSQNPQLCLVLVAPPFAVELLLYLMCSETIAT